MKPGGKYNFANIKKAGAKAILAALAGASWAAAPVAKRLLVIFAPVVDWLFEWGVNWAANNGLVILNLGANWANGEFDQATFDKSIEDALRRIQHGRDKITPEEGAKLDQAIIDAANKFIPFNRE